MNNSDQTFFCETPDSQINSSFVQSDPFMEALNELDEVRAEMIERGKALLADPNYPSREICEKIAGLITPFGSGEEA
ncbi:MAG: hypothetical protein JKY51_09265 [Opitutaceae bacterium]|nr:hypothetical protein [Opitutaceae bacterium]